MNSEKINDWNPQLFRELKSRLKPTYISIVAISAILFQICLLLWFYRQLPNTKESSPGINTYVAISSWDVIPGRSSYGGSIHYAFDANRHYVIDWGTWWFDIFHFLTWMMFLLLPLGGSFLLLRDMQREIRQGTLPLLRLSRQSSQQIFIGKILGVPILLYIAIATFLPVYAIAFLGARLSIIALLIVGLFLMSACSCLYSYALLVSSIQIPSARTCLIWLNGLIQGIGLSLWFWWGSRTREELRYPGYQAWEMFAHTQGEIRNFTLMSLALLAISVCGTAYAWHFSQKGFYAPTSTRAAILKTHD
jgi:ABC-type transport system involved in multi-copper enzyme maturation permease subunit